MRNTVGAFHRLHMEYLRNIINSDVDTEALKITSVLSYKVAINTLQKWINATKGLKAHGQRHHRRQLSRQAHDLHHHEHMLCTQCTHAAQGEPALRRCPEAGPVLSPYKGVPRHEINKETAEITGLLQQLAPRDYEAGRSQMDLTQAVKELDEQNKSIQEAIDKRKSEKAIRIEDRSELSSDELYKYICQIYDELLLHINAAP